MQKKKSLEIFDRAVWEKHNIPPLGGEGGNDLKIRNFPARVPNLVHNICCFGIKALPLQKNTGLCQF